VMTLWCRLESLRTIHKEDNAFAPCHSRRA